MKVNPLSSKSAITYNGVSWGCNFKKQSAFQDSFVRSGISFSSRYTEPCADIFKTSQNETKRAAKERANIFTQNIEEKFSEENCSECVEDLREFYVKNRKSPLQNETTLTDNAILKMDDEGNIKIFFKINSDLESSVCVKVNENDEVIEYDVVLPDLDGSGCTRMYYYNYSEK